MPPPKGGALPLGDSPIIIERAQIRISIIAQSVNEICAHHCFKYRVIAIMLEIILKITAPIISMSANSNRCSVKYCKMEKLYPSKKEVTVFSSRRRHTRLVSDWSSDVCSSD